MNVNVNIIVALLVIPITSTTRCFDCYSGDDPNYCTHVSSQTRTCAGNVCIAGLNRMNRQIVRQCSNLTVEDERLRFKTDADVMESQGFGFGIKMFCVEELCNKYKVEDMKKSRSNRNVVGCSIVGCLVRNILF